MKHVVPKVQLIPERDSTCSVTAQGAPHPCKLLLSRLLHRSYRPKLLHRSAVYNQCYSL